MKNFLSYNFCDNLAEVSVVKFGYTWAELYAQWELTERSLSQCFYGSGCMRCLFFPFNLLIRFSMYVEFNH